MTTTASTASATATAPARRPGTSGRDLRTAVGGKIGMLFEAVLDDGLLRRAHLVEPPHGPVVRGLLQELRLGRRLASDLEHRVAERIERLLRLRLGRLD